jgi:hypothetical protein
MNESFLTTKKQFHVLLKYINVDEYNNIQKLTWHAVCMPWLLVDEVKMFSKWALEGTAVPFSFKTIGGIFKNPSFQFDRRKNNQIHSYR